MTYHHGITSQEINEGTRSIRTLSTAVIGLVATAGAALATSAFASPGLSLVTDIDAAIAAAGDEGTLKACLELIADQTSPTIVVSIVADDDDAAALRANVIGGFEAGQYTGIKALEAAKTKFGVTPRIIGAPGLEDAEIIAALVSTSVKIRAFSYALAPVDTKEAAVAMRDAFGARELMLLWPDGTAGGNSLYTAALALGLRAQIDENIGWHKTLSNVVINGVTGIAVDVTWDLMDPDTDAGYLNGNEVTTIINAKGFRFWGDRTCSADPLFAFENYTRSGQIIRDTIAEAHLYAISKPITRNTASNIVESVNRKLRQWTADGKLLGGKCGISTGANGVDQVKDGKLVIDYDYTPIPPLENLVFQQRITDSYIADLVAGISE